MLEAYEDRSTAPPRTKFAHHALHRVAKSACAVERRAPDQGPGNELLI